MKDPLVKCTFLEYESLEEEIQGMANVIMKHVKPSEEIVNGNWIVKPKNESLIHYRVSEILEIRAAVQEQRIEDAVKITHAIQEFTEADIYKFAAVSKWITNGLESIANLEATMSIKKNKGVWKKAGIERLQDYGQYGLIYNLSKGVFADEEKVKDRKYYEALNWMLYGSTLNEIQEEFQELMSKRNK